MKGKNKMTVRMKLKHLRKRLGIGLKATANLRDITHGKVDKFGGTGMKVAAVVALPLLLAEPVMAQTAILPGYSNGGYGSGTSTSYYPSGSTGGRIYTDYNNVNLENTMSPFARFMESLLRAMGGDSYGYGKREGGNGSTPPRQQN